MRGDVPPFDRLGKRTGVEVARIVGHLAPRGKNQAFFTKQAFKPMAQPSILQEIS